MGLTRSPVRRVQGFISPGIKRPVREANVPPVPQYLVKNETSYVSSRGGHGGTFGGTEQADISEPCKDVLTKPRFCTESTSVIS